MNDGNRIEPTTLESNALRGTWENLGPLFCFAIRDLPRAEVLALVGGLAAGDLLPTWTLRPGLATCTITRDQQVIYKFEFEHQPARFVFVELGNQN